MRAVEPVSPSRTKHLQTGRSPYMSLDQHLHGETASIGRDTFTLFYDRPYSAEGQTNMPTIDVYKFEATIKALGTIALQALHDSTRLDSPAIDQTLADLPPRSPQSASTRLSARFQIGPAFPRYIPRAALILKSVLDVICACA